MNIHNLPERLRLPAQQISHTCRIPIEAATVSLCATLGGVDGQWAGARDCNGVPISARFNLAIAGNRGPLWNRLHQALTGTIESEARMLVDCKRLLAPNKVEFALARIRDRATDNLMDQQLVPADFSEPNAEFLKIDIVQRPTLFLRKAGKDEIVAGIRDSAENLLLLDYLGEDFLRIVLGSKNGRADQEFHNVLVSFMDARQIEVSRGRGRSGSDTVRGKVTGLFGATPESLHAALQTKSDTVSAILTRSAFIDVDHCRSAAQESSSPPPNPHQAAYNWDRLIQEAFWRRRACGEDGYTLSTELGSLPNAFPRYDEFLLDRLAEVPEHQHCYLSEAASWPVRFLALFLAVENDMSPPVWKRLKTAAQELASWLVEHQVSVIAHASSSPSQYLDQDEARMYRKLVTKGPMDFRQLLRSYASQRSEIHRPVMEQLLTKGKIVLNSDGLLEAVKEEKVA